MIIIVILWHVTSSVRSHVLISQVYKNVALVVVCSFVETVAINVLFKDTVT